MNFGPKAEKFTCVVNESENESCERPFRYAKSQPPRLGREGRWRCWEGKIGKFIWNFDSLGL